MRNPAFAIFYEDDAMLHNLLHLPGIVTTNPTTVPSAGMTPQNYTDDLTDTACHFS
jgi:hypothetical protein